MKAFRVVISFHEKDGFSADHLKAAIAKSLSEVNLKLLGFEYQKDAKDLCPELPALNKKLSLIGCAIEYKPFPAPIPYEEVVLGSITPLEHSYQFFDIHSVTPDWIEI